MMSDFRNDVWPQLVAVLVILLGALTAGSGWGLNHGLMLALMGGVMLCSKSTTTLPRWAWVGAGLAALLSLSAFTPAAWGAMPGWRMDLENLGVDTGSLKVVQVRFALEQWVVAVLGGGVALWLGGRRSASPMVPALTLVVGVAVYAVVSRAQIELAGQFGFFPNRNHSATLLAMASLVGLGCCAECLKERQNILATVAVLATAVVLWALMAWSISRAGFVLLVFGALLWFPLAGRRYLNRRVANVLTTMVFIAIVALTALDGRLLERLTSSGERAKAAMVGSVDEGDSGLNNESAIEEFDFRIPTWLDSVECLKSEWVRGFGLGQFRYVFTQHRERTAKIGYQRSLHPESDWLWVATEAGLPAMVVLTCLVFALGRFVWRRSTSANSDKAVRLGCLVGALLLLVHSGFDVPAHRLPLLWLAALLTGLALPARGGQSAANLTVRMRVLGALVLGVGVWLLAASAGVVHGLASETAARARTEAARLFQQDYALVEAARAEGRSVVDLDDSLLVEAIHVLEAVEPVAPLDPEVWRMRAELALQFDDRADEARRCHAVERVLLPNAVEVPLIQAESWGSFDLETTGALWREALRRSVALEKRSPNVRLSRRQTVQRIEQFGRRWPVLQELAEKVIGEDVEK